MMNGGVKNGLSTLNRLLGKKNKDESSSQSKHPSTFSRSMSNLDTSSQHNKIVPLAAMSNAPFEQTFRITVCLPRDQLYVARVGAKTRLAQLMELTCINKQLDRDKYEFRHPLDNSQVFRNDLTIGEVGLNEIRLVPKTERLHNGNNFNLEDLGKMRGPGNRESLSSSEVSRNSRHFPKTTSPYSSTNSLNSVESSGSRSHQPPVAPARKKRTAPRPPSQNSIPEHQDRAVDINRNSTTGQGGGEIFKKPLPVKKNFHVSSPNLSLEENHQLITSAEVHRNGSPVAERYSSVTDLRSHDTPAIVEASNARIRPMSMHIFNGNHHVNGKESSTDVNHSRTSSESSEMRDSLPEPVPRKRQLFAAKKKKAAPAPPPRSFAPVPTPRSIPKSESSADEETKSDATSIRSQESSPSSINSNLPNGNVSKVMLNVDTTDVSPPPVPAVKEEQPAVSVTKQNLMVEERKECIGVKVVEMQPNGPLSIAIKSTVMQKEEPPKVSITEIRRESTNSSDDDDHRVNIYNIKTGKVIEKPVEVPEVQKVEVQEIAKEAAPEVQKAVIAEVSKPEVLEVQKLAIPEVAKAAVPEVGEVSEVPEIPEIPKSAVPTEDPRSPSPLWTYTLPAPPKFADGNSSVPDDVTTLNGNVYYDYMSVADDTRTIQSDSNTTLVSDVDIRPVIREVIPDPYINDLDAEVVNSDLEDGYRMDRETLLQSLEKRRERYIENEFAFLTKMDDEPEKPPPPAPGKVPELEKQQSIEMGKSEVMGELNSVINSKKIESVIRKAEVPEEIETAKPCNLSNFRISAYSNGEEEKPAPQLNGVRENEEEFNEEDFLRRASIDDRERQREFVKRPSLTNGSSQVFRKSTPVARSDSFHSTRTDFPGAFAGTPRSSSYISLLAAQKFESRHSPRNSLELVNPPRRYSSELSITDSPSLQSIEVMKSILSSSRKNSMTHLAEPAEPEIVAENGLQETKIVTVKEIMREKEPEVSQVEGIEQPQKPEKAILVQQKEETEECPKKWVYKGPPKINLSAWSERPKVQVCIKSDSDYCFGGSTTLPRGFRTVEQRVQEEEQKLADAPNHHLPVVRSVEYKKNIQPPEETEPPTAPPAAVAAVILRKPEVRQKPVNRVNSITSASLNARPLSLGNFSKIAPVVRGFRAEEDPAPVKTFTTVSLNRTASVTKVNTPTTPPAASAEPPAQLKKPVLERRTIAVVNGQKNIEVVPFSQHTLRRTGLKEKILAQEEEAQKAPSQPRTFQSRQQTVNHSISLPPAEPIKTPPEPPKPIPEPPKILSTPAPPPPPPQLRPVVRAVVKKQISAPELDPRDQLLNSIRNFNKGSLRKM